MRLFFIVIIIIIFLLWEFFYISFSWWFFTGVWVSTSLQDSSHYSRISRQCCSFDGLHSSSYFQVLQSLYQNCGDCTERINYNWYHRHFYVPLFFSVLLQGLGTYLAFRFFQFYPMISRNGKAHYLAGSLFCWLSIGRLAEIKWSVCILKSHRGLWIWLSWTDSELSIHYLLVWSNLNFLHNSQWITFPNQSCLVLYPFCADLLHSLIRWLVISSLSKHNLHESCLFLHWHCLYGSVLCCN